MNVVILTTETPHHAQYVKSIIKKNKKLSFHVVVEKKRIKAKFKTTHTFDVKSTLFENRKWFSNKKNKIADYCRPIYSNIINNDKNLLKNIIKLKPKFIIVFGTRILSKKFLSNFKNIFNFHGGDIESYRGLDSHLWAIYHKDFNKLYIYLHEAKSKVDSGDYVYREKIVLNSNSNIYSLRYENTNICIKLTNKFINSFLRKKILKKKIKTLGRYYSFMPLELKNTVEKNLNDYIKKI